MPKVITFTMELTDAEHANFFARLAERGAPDAGEDDEAGVAEATIQPGEVDAKGAPWLAEVHSGKKSKNADGTWRLKRGVDQATADAAVAKTLANQPQTTPQSMPTGAAANPLVSPGVPVTGMPTGLPSGLPAATGLPGLPQTAPAPEPVSYDQIVAKYNELATANRVSMDGIGAIYQAAGVVDPNELTTNETLRRKLMDELNKIG